MSQPPYYTITLDIEKRTSVTFNIVEKAVFTEGGWFEVQGKNHLTLTSNDTAGALRFQAVETPQNLILILGVHDGQPWGDIVADGGSKLTGARLLQHFFEGDLGGSPAFGRVQVRRQRPTSHEIWGYRFAYTGNNGRAFNVKLTIN